MPLLTRHRNKVDLTYRRLLVTGLPEYMHTVQVKRIAEAQRLLVSMLS
jgi:hypothetical protein